MWLTLKTEVWDGYKKLEVRRCYCLRHPRRSGGLLACPRTRARELFNGLQTESSPVTPGQSSRVQPSPVQSRTFGLWSSLKLVDGCAKHINHASFPASKYGNTARFGHGSGQLKLGGNNRRRGGVVMCIEFISCLVRIFQQR